jgi:hypothetical protein
LQNEFLQAAGLGEHEGRHPLTSKTISEASDWWVIEKGGTPFFISPNSEVAENRFPPSWS